MTATHRRAAAAVGVLLLLCGSAAAIPPGVRVVNHAAAPGGNGQSWAAAYHDLQDALAEAKVNAAVEQIWVAKGVYRPTQEPGEEGKTFELMPMLEVYGGFIGNEQQLEERDWATNITVLSGDLGESVRVWHVVSAHMTDPSTVLDGFTVTKGRATEESPYGPRGGGMLIQNGSATVRNCVFTGNSATIKGTGPFDHARGGGAYGDGLFENCLFLTNDTVGYGGGAAGSGAAFTDCTFNDNYAFSGGGGFYGSGSFDRCDFVGNSGGTFGLGGGAAALENGGSSFTDCGFVGNGATFDSGAVRGGGTFENCFFHDNVADTGAFGYGEFELTDCHVEASVGMWTGFYWASIIATRTKFIDNDTFRECDILARHCTFRGAESSLDSMIVGAESVSLINCIVRDTNARGVVSMSTPGELDIINSTFVRNGWPNTPAVYLDHPGATARIYNAILWDNGGALEEEQILINAGTLDIQRSIVQGWTGSLGGTHNHGFDPMFADTEGRLAPGSPAIDSGNSSLLPAGITQDLDGNPRLVDDSGTPNTGIGSPPVDRGAFEFQDTTCYANCDQSTVAPVLNVDDFTCFINRFAAAHPLANCDGSTIPPVLNVDDFTCFINAFAAGCP